MKGSEVVSNINLLGPLDFSDNFLGKYTAYYFSVIPWGQ